MSKKNKNIIIRVSDDEKNHLQESAIKCGVTVSEYVRRNVLYKNPTFLSTEERKELKEVKSKLIEIIRIGNLYHDLRKKNLNVVAKTKAIIKLLNKKK